MVGDERVVRGVRELNSLPSPVLEVEKLGAGVQDEICVGVETLHFVDYTGPLAESVLLANTAFRAGGGFDWDAEQLKSSGNPKADDYIFPDFREGWKV